MTEITVVIPCFNGACFIGEALDSVFDQTQPPQEVVIVDDGSTDDSAAIVRTFPVTLIRHVTNRGIGAASNTGIAASHSPVIALLDADDVWAPNHLETLTGLLETFPAAGWAFGASHTFGSGPLWQLERIWGKRTPCPGPTDLWTECFDTVIVPGSAGIVRRTALEAIGGFSEAPALRVAPDYDVWLRLALQSPAVWTPTPTVKYRQHAGQMSFKSPLGQWEAVYASRLAVTEEARRRSDPRAGAITERLVDRLFRDATNVKRSNDRDRYGILGWIRRELQERRILNLGRSYQEDVLAVQIREHQAHADQITRMWAAIDNKTWDVAQGTERLS